MWLAAYPLPCTATPRPSSNSPCPLQAAPTGAPRRAPPAPTPAATLVTHTDLESYHATRRCSLPPPPLGLRQVSAHRRTTPPARNQDLTNHRSTHPRARTQLPAWTSPYRPTPGPDPFARQLSARYAPLPPHARRRPPTSTPLPTPSHPLTTLPRVRHPPHIRLTS